MQVYRRMLSALLLLLLTACTIDSRMASPTVMASFPTSILATTPSALPTVMMTPSPIVHYIEITRVVTVIPTEIHAATHTPDAAQECFNQAMTQVEMNSCAALMRQIAEAELEMRFGQITYLPADDKAILEQIILRWKDLAVQDCEFLYGKTITGSNGNLYYEGGSSAPMLMNICIAERIQQHIQELIYAYLSE